LNKDAIYKEFFLTSYLITCHHYKPINAPTAGAFLIRRKEKEKKGEENIRRTGHNAPCRPSAGWWVDFKCSRD
jgi:hypothetical protein